MNQVALKIKPSEWTRMKWLYTALWVLLTIMQILSGALPPPPPADPLILFTNIIVAAALGGFIAHDLWKLKVRYWPLAIDILIYAVFILGFLALISLKEAGVWNWNDTHLDVPLFVFFAVSTVAAWITENRKDVKIYFRARRFLFISTKNDL
jgi:peptidoglycan/LPS O-acetylase OafA/YrhL